MTALLARSSIAGVALLVALGAGCGRARPPSSDDRAERSLPAREAFSILCDGAEALPVLIEGSRIFLPVTLRGANATETIRLQIDTGGNAIGLVLFQSVADRLGLDEASFPRALDVGGRSLAFPEGTEVHLLDDVSSRALASALHPHRQRKDHFQGQIGAAFLGRHVLCLDPEKQRLGLVPADKLAVTPDDVPWLPLLVIESGPAHARYPFVVGTFPGLPAVRHGLLLDTGAPAGMIDDREVPKLRAAFPSFTGAAGDLDMIGGIYPEVVVRAPSLVVTTTEPAARESGLARAPAIDLGPALLVERPAGTFDRMFGSLPPTHGTHGVIGNDVLLRHRLLIDYGRRRVFVQPASRPPEASASLTRVGLSLEFSPDGCPIIRRLSSTNDARTLAALRVGDVLLSVDGQATCPLLHHQIQALLAGNAGEIRRLRIRRGGIELEVETVVVPLALVGQPGNPD
jgi:hypothetical protein